MVKLNLAPILGRLFYLSWAILLLLCLLIFFASGRLAIAWFIAIDRHSRVEIICQYPRSWPCLHFFWCHLAIGAISVINPLPHPILYLFSIMLFTFIWIRVLSPVLMLFIGILRQMNTRHIYYSFLSHLLIYFTQSFLTTLHWIMIFLTLVTSGLLGWVSFKFFVLIVFLKFNGDDTTQKNGASSSKWQK